LADSLQFILGAVFDNTESHENDGKRDSDVDWLHDKILQVEGEEFEQSWIGIGVEKSQMSEDIGEIGDEKSRSDDSSEEDSTKNEQFSFGDTKIAKSSSQDSCMVFGPVRAEEHPLDEVEEEQ
jgi:hypothetical protein